MTRQRVLGALLLVSVLLLCVSVSAQISRPWRDGSVWNVNFIRIKPGMEPA